MQPSSSHVLIRAGMMAAVGLLAAGAWAQFGGGPAPVEYTEAVESEVRRTAELTGTVESRRSSVVASEVEGLVVELTAREGDRVRAGASLVALRRESLQLRLRAAASGFEEAKARRALALASLERARKLSDDKVISQQQLDDAVSEADAWEARVSQLEAERARLEDDLDRSTVRAPFDGIVVAEHTAEGEWIAAGGAVVELMDFTDLEVTVDVPERHFGGLVRGVAAWVTFDSLDGLVVEGKVRAVVPRANPQSRAFPVKVSIDNTEGRIGVGMLARVALPVGDPALAILVPKDAVVEVMGSKSVFVIGEGDKVAPVPVEVGSGQGSWIVVRGGVAAGDRVVTRGNERLRPDMEVAATLREYELP